MEMSTRLVLDNALFSDHEVTLLIENLSTSSIDVYIKRYEISVVPASKNHFNTVTGNNLSSTPLKAYHLPESTVGVSTYRYVAFDINNPSDSVYVDIIFDIGHVGIDHYSKITSQVYPNPSNGNFSIDVDHLTGKGNLAILDLSGKIVYISSIVPGSNTFNLDLPAGTYLYQIRQNDILRHTQRLVIQ